MTPFPLVLVAGGDAEDLDIYGAGFVSPPTYGDAGIVDSAEAEVTTTRITCHIRTEVDVTPGLYSLTIGGRAFVNAFEVVAAEEPAIPARLWVLTYDPILYRLSLDDLSTEASYECGTYAHEEFTSGPIARVGTKLVTIASRANVGIVIDLPTLTREDDIPEDSIGDAGEIEAAVSFGGKIWTVRDPVGSDDRILSEIDVTGALVEHPLVAASGRVDVGSFGASLDGSIAWFACPEQYNPGEETTLGSRLVRVDLETLVVTSTSPAVRFWSVEARHADYVFACGPDTNVLYRYLKADLTFDTMTLGGAYGVMVMANGSLFVATSNNSGQYTDPPEGAHQSDLYQIDPETLGVIAHQTWTVATDLRAPSSIVADVTYLYIADAFGKVYRIRQTDFTDITEVVLSEIGCAVAFLT
jgi:hypothetical protein